MGCDNSTPKEATKKVVVPISKVLILRNSITGEASISDKALAKAIEAIKTIMPDVQIIERDLVDSPVPMLTEETAEAIRDGKTETEAQQAADALATELIEEIKSVQLILVGLPRYNFGVPTSFKTYLDYLARPNITFKYSEDGEATGLLPDVPVWNVMSAGGVYGSDYYDEWLNTVLSFIGLKTVRYFRVEGAAVGKSEESLEAFGPEVTTALEEIKAATTPVAPAAAPAEAAPAEATPAPKKKKVVVKKKSASKKGAASASADEAPAEGDAAAEVPAVTADEPKAAESAPAAEEAAAPAATEEAAAAPAAEEAAPAQE